MIWLKRNMVLVIGGVVALALLGAAGYYLYAQNQKAGNVDAELQKQIAEFQRLTTRNPSATSENIERAKSEQVRVTELLQEQKAFFAPFGAYTNMDSGSFKALLETTLYDLGRVAKHQGVRTQPNYAYTFKIQRDNMVFESAELLPWTYQLLEIKALSQVFFDARVHSLMNIRRVPSSKRDMGTMSFVTNLKSVTNKLARAMKSPYEITFHGFSSELSAVLDGLGYSPHCFIVKNVNAERAANYVSEPDPAQPSPYIPTRVLPQSTTPSRSDPMASRYGLGVGRGDSARVASRYGLSGGGAAANRYGGVGGATSPYARPPGTTYVPGGVRATSRRGPEVVLDEHLLKITMIVDVVRLDTTAQAN